MDEYGNNLTTPDWITAEPDAGAEYMVGEEGGASDVINRPAKTNFSYIQQIVSGAIGFNLVKNGGFEIWPSGTSSAPEFWTLAGTGAAVARSTTRKRGAFSAQVTYGSDAAYLYQDFDDYASFQGEKVTVSAWVKCSTASIACIRIDDGVTANSSYHTGGGSWELLVTEITLDAAATRLRVECRVEGAGNAIFDAVKLEEGEVETAFNSNPVESGRIVQVKHTQDGEVATGTTKIPLDDTIPQNTEGDEYMSLSITPTDANNKLLIDVTISLSSSLNDTHILVGALFQDSTADALAVGCEFKESGTNRISTISFKHEMTAGTTSTTTFKVRGGCTKTGTTTFNGQNGNRRFGGVMASTITITEIAV
jgi:hypothetical protein